MRDKKDHATLELPGFDITAAPSQASSEATLARAPRKSGLRQEQLKQLKQLELLDETDTSGLPVWRRDEHTDLTGLPIWAAAPSAC